MIEIQFPFPHLYEIEEVVEFPGTGAFPEPLLYFPEPKGRPEHDGLWLKVRDKSSKSWIGVFKFGYSSPPAFSRVISTPDPQRICVISNGSAYMVKTDQPELWESIPVLPVLDVRPIKEHGLLIFSDYTRLAAYDSSGFSWQSPRVCWDDLKILNVTENTIEGVGYDPTNCHGSHQLNFAVDLRTGRSLLPSPTSIDGKSLW